LFKMLFPLFGSAKHSRRALFLLLTLFDFIL